jgi:hypothetical protein
MDYGKLLSRAWNIIWENKFLILLGVLVALGSASSGGGGGGNTASSLGEGDFDVRSLENLDVRPRELLREIGVPALTLAVVLVLLALALTVGIALWVVSTIARGGLIAGASTIDAGAASSFSQAWSAGWRKGWTLLGIGILPAIPGVILVVMGLGTAGMLAGVYGYGLTGGEIAPLLLSGPAVILAALACILLPIALLLSLLQTLANRACMLEDLGVFASYRRGINVLLQNIGPALVLFLIQIAIGIAVGIAMFIPGILILLCCVLWPLLLLINGAKTAYFSTLWTLAWREWTGQVVETAAATE